MTTSTKKRDRSMFDAVQKIETEDAVARTKRRATSVQMKAASRAALSQQAIYGKLIELRILAQRALQAENGISREEQRDGALDECTKLLCLLLNAQSQLAQHKKSKSMQEIETVVEDNKKLEKVLHEDFEKEQTKWKEVLDRRHKEVRLHAGLAAKSQFRVLDSSFWQQVESTIRHERMQQGHKKDGMADASSFDDSKIYQHLLKEFVTSHPSKDSDSRAQDRLRSAGTRRTVNNVDRRASKGRKLRYTPIPKLANFTFPLSRPVANLEDDAWFKSLFGGAASKKKSD